ncbi:MAG: hypothetical protein U9R31_02245 [Candidatus Omnitrophota bacterium]|nr:hypothetical protein [Candidatus Omnitrophota bacterium]
MNLEEKWDRAVKKTEIIRARLSNLLTLERTSLPYIFLAESSVNIGDTVVRKGRVLAHKPLIVLPQNFPQFEGFEFEKDYETNEDMVRSLLLMRGISFPSLKYNNEISTIEVHEQPLVKAIKHFSLRLEKKEDIRRGLIIGPEDTWQFSLLIYVSLLITRSASNDINKLLEDFRKKMGLD